MLTDEGKIKAVKTFKLQLNGVFQPFLCYGLQDFVPGAKEQATELALLLHKRLNYVAWQGLDDEIGEAIKEILTCAGFESLLGQDIPITFEHANGKLRERYRKR